MKGKANEIHGKLVGASLRGLPTPGTSRVLWQLNSYDQIVRLWYEGFQPANLNPAQMQLQASCAAMIAEQGISALIRVRPH